MFDLADVQLDTGCNAIAVLLGDRLKLASDSRKPMAKNRAMRAIRTRERDRGGGGDTRHATNNQRCFSGTHAAAETVGPKLLCTWYKF